MVKIRHFTLQFGDQSILPIPFSIYQSIYIICPLRYNNLHLIKSNSPKSLQRRLNLMKKPHWPIHLIIISMNKYEVQGVIDEGAYGIVLKAFLRDTDQIVAIKKFKETDEDPAVRGPIQRQIRMLKALRSEFVVDLKEAFRRKGKVYLVFEYMEKNLLQLIEQHPTGIQPDQVMRLTYQLIKCVHFMHKKDVVHRDLKPENLLLTGRSTLKLCDFGFTRSVGSSDEALTDYVATRWYRSPELLVGEPYGKALDIWSIGCIVYEMLTGEPLFPGENQIDQIHLIRRSLGELTIEQTERIKVNPRFVGVKFPEIRKLDTIEAKLQNKASKTAILFIKDCLKMDPNQRLTASAAIEHPYFASLRSANVKHSTTQRTDYASPPMRREGVTTQQSGSRARTIYANRSNQNVWRFAGAPRFDKTKFRKIMKDTAGEMIPQLQLTITHMNNRSPDSNRSPSKETIKSYVKAKMSLNAVNNTQNQQGRRLRGTLKNEHDRLINLKISSLANVYHQRGFRNKTSTIQQPNINFSITGQTKSLIKKL